MHSTVANYHHVLSYGRLAEPDCHKESVSLALQNYGNSLNVIVGKNVIAEISFMVSFTWLVMCAQYYATYAQSNDFIEDTAM